MQKLVKLSALAVAMGLAAAAQADVSVPTFKGGFDVSLESNYSRATGADPVNDTRDDKSNITNMNSVDQPNKFGFGVDIGYKFPGTANDVRFSYSQFKSDADALYNVKDEFLMDHEIINPTTGESQYLTTVDSDKAKNTTAKLASFKASEFKFQDANLNFGQYINIGSNMQVRLSAGIAYAKLQQELTYGRVITGSKAVLSWEPVETTTEYGKLENYSITQGNYSNSTFKGFGPTLGIEGNYQTNFGLGLVAGTSVGLLFGKTDYEAGKYLIVNGTIDGQAENDNLAKVDTIGSAKRVVPTVEAKLGVTYARALNDNYEMGVEAGYQVKSYFNALNANTGGGNILDDVSLSGPYLKLKLAAC